jgi:hypothetical protein
VRSTVLLLLGFGMVAAGVAVALGVDGGVLPGVALAVLGLCVKAGGFLLGGDPAADAERGPQTLAGRRVERPRAGIPVGRATVRRRVPSRAPAAVVRPLSDARRPASPGAASPASGPQARHRRAS